MGTPLVVGELQQHAIGCYSAYRPIKTAVRRAEHLVRQAEIADPCADLQGPKERVAFAHFHDTFGGTCLPSAYPQILDRLGGAAADADEAIQLVLRRRLNDLPPHKLQRVVAYNASDLSFAGYATHDPWLDWRSLDDRWRLLNEAGEPVSVQRVRSEAAMQDTSFGMPSLLFRADLPAGGLRVWYLDRKGAAQEEEAVAAPVPLPIRFELYEDPSDTWSHGLTHYAEVPIEVAGQGDVATIAQGPVMSAACQTMRLSDSLLTAVWRAYANEPFIELELTVNWRERHRLLKLVLSAADRWSMRRDGIMGGSLERPLDGRELPLRDWTLLDGMGVVCPDVYSMDATPVRARMTLLRSPAMAHHGPHPGFAKPPVSYSDDGVHRFRFRFFQSADERTLELHAAMLQRPLVFADLTRGM